MHLNSLKQIIPEEIVNKIITQATQPPEKMSRWSTRTMARAVGVSQTTVIRIWQANNIKLHITNDLIRDGSFKSVKELENSINNYLSDRNKNPKRYVWKKRRR